MFSVSLHDKSLKVLGILMSVKVKLKADILIFQVQSANAALRTPPQHGHLSITDSLLCPWRNKALTFSLNSTCLIRTPR